MNDTERMDIERRLKELKDSIDFLSKLEAPSGGGGSGDMLKSTYDTDNDGIVDSSEAVNGVGTAGNSKYYGTNSGGTPGFYDLPSGGGSTDILQVQVFS